MRPTVFTSMVLLVVIIGVLGVVKDNQSPDFVLVADGILWLTSDGDVYADMKRAADYLKSRGIPVRAMYIEKAYIISILDLVTVDPELTHLIQNESGVLIDVRSINGETIINR